MLMTETEALGLLTIAFPDATRDEIDTALQRLKNASVIGRPGEAPSILPIPDDVPIPCRTCSQHPYNGGSGICNCTLGMTPVTC